VVTIFSRSRDYNNLFLLVYNCLFKRKIVYKLSSFFISILPLVYILFEEKININWKYIFWCYFIFIIYFQPLNLSNTTKIINLSNYPKFFYFVLWKYVSFLLPYYKYKELKHLTQMNKEFHYRTNYFCESKFNF
jgi:hypothetical protein